MAYKLTPEQYKDAAKNRVANQNTAENTNSAVSAYARALNARRGLDNKNRSGVMGNTPAIQSNDNEQANGDWLTRTLATVASPAIRLVEGAAKFIENAVLDLGAGLTASMLDVFGADDAAEDVQRWAAQDFIGEAFDWSLIEDIYRNSYSNEWGKFGEILQECIYSVGQQAIPLALNLLTGGTAGTLLSMGTFAMGAYGGGFESASQDGGSVLSASAYGLLSAGIETAIEGIGGALNWGGGTVQALDDLVARVSKREGVQKALGIVLDSVGEGAEEVVSGMLNNYIKAMSYKGDYSSFEAYFNNILSAPLATQEELFEQFILGAVAGGMMGGASHVITKASPTRSTAETIQEINNLKEKGYNLSLRGRNTAEVETQFTQKETELMEQVNKNFDRFTKQRKKGNTADGILSYMEQNFNTDESGRFISSKNTLIHSENASYGIGQAELDDALGTHGKLHEGAFEGDALISKQKVEKALKNINAGLGRNRLKVVFADMSDAQDYGYIKNNVIVVNAAHLGTQLEFKVIENGNVTTYKADAGLSTLLHEVLHFTDDTKAGKQLQKLLNKYAIDQQTNAMMDTFELLKDSQENGESFDFNGELSARQLEYLLFNENIINRLTEDNSSLSKRILNKATYILNALKGEKLAETKELRTLLSKTVKLYNKAIAQVGKGKRISSKGVDKENEIEYSKRTNKFKYQPRDFSQITESEYKHHAWATVNGVLSQNETGAFIEKVGERKRGASFNQSTEGYYMIPVGENGIENKVIYTDGNWDAPSIEKVIKIKAADETSIDIVRGYLYESKGIIDIDYFHGLLEIYDAEGFQYGAQRGGGRQNSSNNQRINDGNGTSGKIRKSRRITDSQGRELTKEQAEFFKNSKAVDNDGNLQVVYHGTVGEFYTFDKNYRGHNTGARDAKLGFFFTSSHELANEYAVEALDNSYFNKIHEISRGDKDIIEWLYTLRNHEMRKNSTIYKELAATQEV